MGEVRRFKSCFADRDGLLEPSYLAASIRVRDAARATGSGVVVNILALEASEAGFESQDPDLVTLDW